MLGWLETPTRFYCQAKILSVGIASLICTFRPAAAPGGAEGYHSPDPFWRETPAKSWGLDFVAKQYGNILVISTKNEIEYIHHHYALENLSVRVPKGIQVIRAQR